MYDAQVGSSSYVYIQYVCYESDDGLLQKYNIKQRLTTENNRIVRLILRFVLRTQLQFFDYSCIYASVDIFACLGRAVSIQHNTSIYNHRMAV